MSDLISRQAVLDYPIRLDHYDEEHGNRHFVLGIESVMEYVEYLPSADRPTGEWVRKYDKQINCYWYECNQCGEYRPRNVLGKEWSSPYCPNCGAIMYKGGDSDG